MDILTMSTGEIRDRDRALRVCLWGSLERRQFGSRTDLLLAEFERRQWERMTTNLVLLSRAARAACATAAEYSRGFAKIAEALSTADEVAANFHAARERNS